METGCPTIAYWTVCAALFETGFYPVNAYFWSSLVPEAIDTVPLPNREQQTDGLIGLIPSCKHRCSRDSHYRVWLGRIPGQAVFVYSRFTGSGTLTLAYGRLQACRSQGLAFITRVSI